MSAHQNIGFPTLYDDQKGQKTHNEGEAGVLRRQTGENVEGFTASTFESRDTHHARAQQMGLMQGHLGE
jgi:hypothetical protein